jgi:hypothetical protein
MLQFIFNDAFYQHVKFPVHRPISEQPFSERPIPEFPKMRPISERPISESDQFS